jgi:hypothetical protein
MQRLGSDQERTEFMDFFSSFRIEMIAAGAFRGQKTGLPTFGFAAY